MKLAAIYNLFDGEELLRGSMECLRGEVDLFVIIYQNVSNFGEKYEPLAEIDLSGWGNVIFYRYNPTKIGGFDNEKAKRNLGLDIARANNCTHLLHIDCDEYYENFAEAKKQYINAGTGGSVCKIFTYFKLPTLRFERECGYYVPFIHRLRQDTVAGVKKYPFYVDPTRRINENRVSILDIHMHHFSYVRKDIERKCRNSSARNNIAKNKVLDEYNSPDIAPGYFVKSQGQKLIEVENKFNIQL